jgi:trigger factor
MRTELLGQEKNVVRVKVEFEAAEFMSNLNEVIREITQKANIPGFRKGRIPRRIIEMRFGKDSLHQEALEKMLPEALKQVTDDYDLDMMDAPSLKIDDIKEGEPVTCELVIEVRPEIELPELEDIEVERLRQQVSDETLDIMTAEFRKQNATLNPVDRAAGDSDVVSASFVTRVLNPDGSEVSGGEPQPGSIDLSEPSVRPEVRDALLGKSKGDEAGAEFDVEPDYRDASLAGKRVRYEIKVDAVNEKILPDIGPEFFKKVMDMDIETEAEFREEMKKRLLEHQENEETERVREEAVKAAVARSKLDVPDSMMERQAAYVKEQDAIEIKRRHNIGMDEYLGKISVGLAEYEREVREKADAVLRRTLVLNEIGKKFDVDVTKEELDAEMTRRAALFGMDRAKARAYYYKNEEHMSQLASGLRYDKVSRLLLDKIKINHVDKLSGDNPADVVAEGAE